MAAYHNDAKSLKTGPKLIKGKMGWVNVDALIKILLTTLISRIGNVQEIVLSERHSTVSLESSASMAGQREKETGNGESGKNMRDS